MKTISVESLFEDNKIQTKTNWVTNDEALNSDFSKLKSLKKEDFILNDLAHKEWVLSFYHNGSFMNYGPINTVRVFLFLKNVYLNLPKSEKDKKNFMVVDYLCDVYFQPDNLYEILKTEFPEGFFENSLITETKLQCPNVMGQNPYLTNNLFQPLGKLRIPSALKENLPFSRPIFGSRNSFKRRNNSKHNKPVLNWRRDSLSSQKSQKSTKYSTNEEENDTKKKEDTKATLDKIFS